MCGMNGVAIDSSNCCGIFGLKYGRVMAKHTAHTVAMDLALPECNKCIVVSVSSRCVV